MTKVQIVNAVLADAFKEGKRANAETWVEARHAWLWDLEEWTFREGSAPITFTSNSQIATGLPSDFHAVEAIYDTNGKPLRGYKDHREFFDRYNTELGNGPGSPEAYTVYGGQILIGPNGDGSIGLLLYDKSKPDLATDGALSGLPGGYDLALVHGGKAEGFKLSNVPLWQGFDDDFTAFANAMRRNYLVAVKEQGTQQFRPFRP